MSDTLQSITLVRHGMTEWAADGRHTSVTDIGLTREGREEALALWTLFRDNGHQFDGIYTSPLPWRREDVFPSKRNRINGK